MMWYLVLSERIAEMTAIKARTAEHFAWMRRQHLDGSVLISGPTPDRTMGIYVVRAESDAAARTIADSDPFHLHGLRQYKLLPWEVHQMLGLGPFSLPGVQFLANEHQDGRYTPLPDQ